MAMGAVICGGRGHEHGSGGVDDCLGRVAGEGDGCEDELATTFDDEAGETRPGIGCTEFDEVEVAIELLPVLGEDASAGVGFISSVFGAIGTCLALYDDTLGGFGEGVGAAVAVVGIRGRRPCRGSSSGIGCKETLGLFESPSSRNEVFSQHLGVAIAGGEELGELGV